VPKSSRVKQWPSPFQLKNKILVRDKLKYKQSSESVLHVSSKADVEHSKIPPDLECRDLSDLAGQKINTGEGDDNNVADEDEDDNEGRNAARI